MSRTACAGTAAGALLCLCLAAGCPGSPAPDPPAPPPEPVTGPAAPQNARLPHELPPPPPPRAPRADDWFEDVASQAGVRSVYRDGSEAGFYELIESVGGGVAAFDYDRDGDCDLFFTGGGRLVGPPVRPEGWPGVLYRNEGGLRFTDVTAEAGLAAADLYTHGCTVGDYDRDGWPDLLIAGFGGVRLFRNLEGRFENVTAAAGLTAEGWCVMGAFADYDGDGQLDLYVVTYADLSPGEASPCVNDRGLRDICGPTVFRGSSDRLYRNRGDGSFEDVTSGSGLVERNRGLGIVAADLNADGALDFYVANDVEENQLYLGGEWPLRNVAPLAGAAFSPTGEREGSMGVDAADFDGDGRLDLWYTNYSDQDNTLLRKADGLGYLPATEVTGLAGVSRPWVGFGTALADFSGDGWPDLFVANGHVAYDRADAPYFQPAQLFRSEEGRRFTEVSEEGGPYFSTTHAGRGAATVDLDDDGGLDLVVVHQNAPAVLLRNRRPPAHWVRFTLRGAGHPDAIGARVEVRQGQRTLTQWRRSGSGYASHFDPRLLYSLAEGGPVAAVVRWPGGGEERFSNLAAGQTHELVEGAGEPPGE